MALRYKRYNAVGYFFQKLLPQADKIAKMLGVESFRGR